MRFVVAACLLIFAMWAAVAVYGLTHLPVTDQGPVRMPTVLENHSAGVGWAQQEPRPLLLN